jgi:hypothetical protein
MDVVVEGGRLNEERLNDGVDEVVVVRAAVGTTR